MKGLQCHRWVQFVLQTYCSEIIGILSAIWHAIINIYSSMCCVHHSSAASPCYPECIARHVIVFSRAQFKKMLEILLDTDFKCSWSIWKKIFIDVLNSMLPSQPVLSWCSEVGSLVENLSFNPSKYLLFSCSQIKNSC